MRLGDSRRPGRRSIGTRLAALGAVVTGEIRQEMASRRGRQVTKPTAARTVGLSATLAGAVVALDILLPGLPGAGIAGRLMALMSAICSQRPSHSYFLGAQLPLEARMYGLAAGFAAGAATLSIAGRARGGWRLPHWPLIAVLLALIGWMTFDGVNALFFDLGFAHAYLPKLELRLTTGLGAGIAMAFILVPLIRRMDVVLGWSDPGPRASWRPFSVAVVLAGLVAALTGSGWSWLWLPVALLGDWGAVLAFALLNRALLGGPICELLPVRTLERREWALAASACGLMAIELSLLSLTRTWLVTAIS